MPKYYLLHIPNFTSLCKMVRLMKINFYCKHSVQFNYNVVNLVCKYYKKDHSSLKGRISQFSACPYTDWPVHAFWHRLRFFIVYEPIVSKLPNFAFK